jgi:hypothetical protein
MGNNDVFDGIKDISKEEVNEKRNQKGNTKIGQKKIEYEIKDEDDDIVQLLKQKINEKDIHLYDMYDEFGRETGYNTYYGLSQRTSISFKNLRRWADFLDLKVVIDLVDKD